MKRKWILSVNILLCFLIKNTATQYDNSEFRAMQFQYYPYNFPLNQFQKYPDPKQMYVNNKSNLEDFYYEEYNDYDEENVCLCEDCDNLKPSCRNMCPNCLPTPSPLPNPGYIFLPFPYPYPTTTATKTTTHSDKLVKTTITTSEPTTTDATTQNTNKEIGRAFNEPNDATIIDKLDESKVPDVIAKSFQVKHKSPYTLTSLRRTKPNWIPKYGIVPISDQFAEKLMLQLRSMKVLHSSKDYLRDINELTTTIRNPF